jgi:hypothetical protein
VNQSSRAVAADPSSVALVQNHRSGSRQFPRVLDAIQGQAPRSVADTYGRATARTMAAEIAKLPAYDLNRLRSVSQPG